MLQAVTMHTVEGREERERERDIDLSRILGQHDDVIRHTHTRTSHTNTHTHTHAHTHTRRMCIGGKYSGT